MKPLTGGALCIHANYILQNMDVGQLIQVIKPLLGWFFFGAGQLDALCS